MHVPGGVWCPDPALGTKRAFPLFSNPFSQAGAGRSAIEWFDALCRSDALRDSGRNAERRGSPGGRRALSSGTNTALGSTTYRGKSRSAARPDQVSRAGSFGVEMQIFVTSELRFAGKCWKMQHPGKTAWQNCIS